jgi:hypothetical protein
MSASPGSEALASSPRITIIECLFGARSDGVSTRYPARVQDNADATACRLVIKTWLSTRIDKHTQRYQLELSLGKPELIPIHQNFLENTESQSLKDEKNL